MKRIFYTLFGASLLLSGMANSQSHRNCGTMDVLHQLELQDPSFRQRRETIERDIQHFISSGNSNKISAVVTIPVVVHVLYRTTAENISDAQINSQIAILNADYRKLNADASLIPSAWTSTAADCQIQFCLAQRDPSGNATTGIVRKSTTVTSFSSNDNIKRSANGGDDAWSSSSYLNIWVGTLSGGLLGYAQFPGGSASTDGVVILNTAFGNTGTAAAPFNKGRTATHEVGHWLNLYHIWGDDGSACSGSDQVTDTPNQAGENYGCPSFPKTDACTSTSPGVMWMNYMDYTDDACMYMFTNGQSTRMNATLNGTRASLLTSQGCVPPSGGGTCGTPGSLSAGSITTSSAVVSWAAVSGATSYNLQYKLSSSGTWSTVSTSSTSYSLSGLASNSTYNYQVQAVCASGNSAYSSTSSFTTLNSSSCSDPYEPNNSRNAAKTITPGTDINALIGSTSDNDYYKFTNSSSQKNIKVIMDNLPYDYDMKLLSSNGSTLNTSQNGGTTAEQIIRNNASVGTYYVRVYGYGGAYSTSSCYHLKVSISSTTFRDAGDVDMTATTLEKVTGIDGLTLYPNPANSKLTIAFFNPKQSMVNLQFVDLLGKVVRTETISAQEGFNQQQVFMDDFQEGVYMVRLESEGQTVLKKLVIRH